MKNIIVLGASSSKKSINQKLAVFAGRQIQGAKIIVLDLNDFEMPIYSSDKEEENGIPKEAQQFKEEISKADGIIISFAEHNGSFSAAYKNVFDWTSRIDMDVWQGKPLLILATSPGGMGGSRVLNHAESLYGYKKENLVKGIALPKFYDHFTEEGIQNEEYSKKLKESVAQFEEFIA